MKFFVRAVHGGAMNSSDSWSDVLGNRWGVRFLSLWLGGMWLLALLLLYQHAEAHNGWVLGDWMIDYRQGFVRRGLSGALGQTLASVLPGSALMYVTGMIMLIWTMLVFCFWSVLRTVKIPVWYLLLLLSPAGLLFSVYGADQVGRKEVLLFATMAAFVLYLMRARDSTWLAHLGWAFWGGVLCLMHEASVFFGIYFLLAAWWSGRGRSAWLSAIGLYAGMIAASLLLLLWSAPFDGRAYCASLVMSDRLSASMCDGTISWPIVTIRDSWAHALMIIDRFDYLTLYGISLGLIVAPVVAWFIASSGQSHQSFLRTLGLLATAWFLTIPLFLIAVDWGRFIQIHVVLTALVLTLRLPRRQNGVTPPDLPSWSGNRWYWCALVLTLFTYTLWNLPVCCQSEVGGGLLPKLDAAMERFERFVSY